MPVRAIQLSQDHDVMGHPASPASQPSAATPISLPSPHPSTGVLCTARKRLTYDDLLFAVTNHHLQQPLPVRPVVMGFLPFDDGQIQPRYLLQAEDLLVMRMGVVSKTVPSAAIKRLMSERRAAYLAEHGKDMPAVASRLLRSDCITSLLSTALASERDALIFYRPSTGRVFLAEQGLSQAEVVLRALATFVPQLECKAWRPSRSVGEDLRGWVLEQAQPAAFLLGDSLKMATAKGTSVAFRNANMCSPELLSHFDQGSRVIELGLKQVGEDPPMDFTFDTTGILRRIRLGESSKHEGLTGLSLLLAGLIEFADAIFPCADHLIGAISREDAEK